MNYPEHWSVAELQDLGEWKTGSTPRRSREDYWGGDILWVSPKDMKTDRIVDTEDRMTRKALEETNSKIIPPGSLIIVTRSGILEHSLPVAVNEEPVTINQDLKALTPSDNVNEDYLYYFMKASEIDVLKNCSKDGTTVASINSDDLYTYEAPLAPFAEQKRIVGKIEKLFSKLDSGVSDLEDAKNRLELYNRAVLKAAMNGDFTSKYRKDISEDGADYLEEILEHRRQKWDEEFQEVFKYSGKDYEEPEDPEPPENVDIPDKWTWSSINQISYVIGGLTKNKSKREDYSIEVPYLRVANVYANELDLDEVKTIRISEREERTKLLKEGDLLVVEGNGSKSQIGRVAMWDGSISPCSHQNHLIKVRVLSEELRRFAVYWMLSPLGRRSIVDVASSTSGLYTLSVSKVRDIPIPIPPPQEAKRIFEEIDRRMSVADQVFTDVEDEILRADRLRQSILKCAFEGELIQYDPTDESTAESLESRDANSEFRRQITLSEVTNDAK